MNRSVIEQGYRRIQTLFTAAIEGLDGEASFGSDVWERQGGGGGDTRMLVDGPTIEKAAGNFSAVWGETPQGMSGRLPTTAAEFYATGVSIIVHPRNPHAPTFHANLRYFETDTGEAWFGGGADLTPYYLYEEDAAHFHRVIREACTRHVVADYQGWKQACDEYFHLPHRGEARGVGGIFFDHLTDQLDQVWEFQQDLGDQLLSAYLPILERRINTAYGPDAVLWHEIRRGRYAEFNLVWDRGTRFGLETGGRTESVLASLPPRARWVYDHHPEPGTPEEALLNFLRSPSPTWE